MLGTILAIAIAASGGPPPALVRPSPALRILPSGTGAGVSQSHACDFCSLFASEMTSNHFCWTACGASTGQAFSAFGSPTDQTDRLCPNGPDCGTLTGKRTSTGNRYQSAAVDSPSGDLSLFWYGIVDDATGVNGAVTKSDIATTSAVVLRFTTSTYVGFAVWSATGVSECAPVNAISSGAPYFITATYKYVTDGTSVGKIYSNGSLIVTCSNMKGPPIAASTIPWAIGGYAAGTNAWPLKGVNYLAGMTQKELSGPMIANMSAALQAQFQGTRGETITTTRTTVRSCCTDDANCTLLAANRPPVQGAALEAWGNHSNLTSRSTEFGSWTCTNASVTSADSTVSPFAAKTADTITSTVAGGYCDSAAFAIASTSANASVWASVASGTQGARLVLRDTTAGADRCTVDFTATTAWDRIDTCSSAALTSGNNHVVRIYPGGASGTGAIIAYGAQTTAGSTVAAPFCPTFATAPVACNADNVGVPRPSGFVESSGSFAADVVFTEGGSASAARILLGTVGSATPANGLYAQIQASSGQMRCTGFNNAANVYKDTVTLAWTPGVTYRVAYSWDTVGCRMYRDGIKIQGNGGTDTWSSSPFTIAQGPGVLYIGSNIGNNVMNGTISNICVDQDPEACR